MDYRTAFYILCIVFIGYAMKSERAKNDMISVAICHNAMLDRSNELNQIRFDSLAKYSGGNFYISKIILQKRANVK